jgi:hypothetical protein
VSYFSSFPTISYSNTAVTDITRRVTIPQSVLRQPTAFSPYTVEAGQRDDTVAFLYYGQDDDDWLVWLANQIVDPYYGWYLDIDELGRHVIAKYGSLADAMQRVDHWASNWASDYREITTGNYASLTENLKKYWIPNYGAGSDVLSYSRRPEDWTLATNRILGLTLGSPALGQRGDLATVYDPGGNMQGTGELVWVSGNDLKIKDVQGTWAIGYTVKTINMTGTVTALDAPILMVPIDEAVYYSPVTCYDREYDANEENKEVLLVQDAYRGIMYSELTSSLRSPAP